MAKTLEHYQHLHQIPELGFVEFKTSAYIADALEVAGFKRQRHERHVLWSRIVQCGYLEVGRVSRHGHVRYVFGRESLLRRHFQVGRIKRGWHEWDVL